MRSVGVVLLLVSVGCRSGEVPVKSDVDRRGRESASEFGSLSPEAPPETAHWGQAANSPAVDGSPRITRFTATSEATRIMMRRGNGDPD